jgi:hypothetical protein
MPTAIGASSRNNPTRVKTGPSVRKRLLKLPTYSTVERIKKAVKVDKESQI